MMDRSIMERTVGRSRVAGALTALLLFTVGCGVEFAGGPEGEDEPADEEAIEEEAESPIEEVRSPRRSEDDFHAGVAVLSYGDDDPDAYQAKSAAALNRLAELHANSVSLVFPVFQDDWRASEVRADPDQTPSDRNIATFIREGKMRNFTVLLRPILDEQSLIDDGQWRGSIRPADPDAWFESYGRLLLHYATIADREGADIVAVGTEFTSLQGDGERWRALISRVRDVFGGQVTYATNWDTTPPAHHPAFLGALDFLSVDAFFPLEAGPGAGVPQLAEAWRPWIEQLQQFGPSLDEIVFTEVGVRAQEGAYLRPHVWAHDAEASPETQRHYYAATCRAVADRIGGLYWWTVDIHSPVEAQTVEDFSPLGKPAEREILRCYRGRS
jgi:hypothetical protein